ncbi:phospholipase D-like domain-containing protein [Dinoroseobacter sp. PD6]|uniref:phospholipase D family protein n=1 Tax=Dinoroseobacter sp. PD6 TaxID=3028384 RepID=UPI00237A3814|nr:phospholipase D-like domain-containing protein [Dinoroseobacter sp. PD6]MDD9718987.1 phospholipase D-like domain-containing protein [Dinoroseobacter sp. PD6]
MLTSQDRSHQAENSDARVQVLITAAEAFPELERAFLAASSEIWASFRVFDLRTKLRSDAAKAIGETWFDLVEHTLSRGVAIHMAISDFDAIMAPRLHNHTWNSMRAFLAAAEIAGPQACLDVVGAAHPARAGRPHRVLVWPWVYRRLAEVVEDLNADTPDRRARRLEHLPGLARHVEKDDDGFVRAKRWPPADLLPVTHHQKLAVFDRKTVYIGGLDLDERRYDDPDHQRGRDETWHDVQLMVEGGALAREAQSHVEQFLKVTAGRGDPPPATELLTTVSRRHRVTTPFLGPKPVRNTLLEAHLARIESSEDLIYLETQFFRDIRIADALAKRKREAPSLDLIVVLPGAPEDVAFDGATSSDAKFGEFQQVRAFDRVQQAFGEDCIFCAPVRPEAYETGKRDCLAGSPIIYVHAKLAIFDTTRAIVSSANLNGRSLSWDTEAGLELDDPEMVAHLQRRTFSHWYGEDAPEAFLAPDTAVAEWRKRAMRNLQAKPSARQGFLVPYDPERARAFGRWVPGVPDALV